MNTIKASSQLPGATNPFLQGQTNQTGPKPGPSWVPVSADPGTGKDRVSGKGYFEFDFNARYFRLKN
jgi:hypothetical protein